MDKYTGKRLDGRYEIHELLGVGGMAVVYRAYDTIDDRMVAIKILKDEFRGNEEFIRRFRNESKAIAVLSHPNIVKVYDVSFGDRLQYIVMEYIDGITLKEYLDQQKLIKWKEAIHFTVQILRALQHAHEKGIVHRDIKPQNIMLLQDGTIKMTDFGIARFAKSETRTMTDKAIGSVHYIAPEQARGEMTDEKTDIYSVGVMLYEMLTGQLPFEADNAVSVAIMQLQTNPKPLREINPDIPEGLEEITLKAMQKNPSQRYQSAAEMLEDIERFRRNPSINFEYKYFVDDTPTKYVDAINSVKGNTAPVSYDDNYEYEEPEDTPVRSSSKTKMIIAGFGLALLIVAMVFGGMAIYNSINKSKQKGNDLVALPNFVGKIYDKDVQGNDKYKDFVFKIQEGKDPSKPVGMVLAQTPGAGISVKKNKEILLTVNASGKEIAVPDLVGLKQADAEKALRDHKLIPQVVTVTDDHMAEGFVTETNPPKDSMVSEGTTVRVLVSSGPQSEAISVPQVIDKTLEAAKTEIIAAGLTVGEVTKKDDSDKKKDVVIETNPLPGVKLSSGDKVNIIISSGKKSKKTIDVIVNLPRDKKNPQKGINADIKIRVYRNGSLEKTDTCNPSVNDVYPLRFEGTSGKDKLVIMLDDQKYQEYTLDFDTNPGRPILNSTIPFKWEDPSQSSSSQPKDPNSEKPKKPQTQPDNAENSGKVTRHSN